MKRAAVLLTMILVLAACGLLPEPGSYIPPPPEQNPNDFVRCTQIYNDLVPKGSTPEQVVQAVGQPRAKKPSRLLDVEEEWVYVCGSTIARVCFANGLTVGNLVMPTR